MNIPDTLTYDGKEYKVTKINEDVFAYYYGLEKVTIGANVRESNYAQSKADFISKLQIALKECYETEYWLELFVKANIVEEDKVKKLLHDCGELRRILVSSVTTLKNN